MAAIRRFIIICHMLDYAKALNEAQYKAVTCPSKAALVIAGAGSGKTRTIVYRMAWLVEHGISPESILLLTFTRKAAAEMLNRASSLLAGNLDGVAGGTFHSFAYGALRRSGPAWLENRAFTLMDQSDVLQALRDCKAELKICKKDPSFPKAQALASILSKARNKELPITEVLQRDNYHLLPHAEALEKLAGIFAAYKRDKGLLDYDDLLFELEEQLKTGSRAATYLRAQYSHILVDEYQDTNLVQARLVRLLSGLPQNDEMAASVMAVGDDAQSIYGFRGANVNNILDFHKIFPGTEIIRLEENYRSTQPILNVANEILSHASDAIHKNLFTNKSGGEAVKVIVPLSDASEAELVVRKIGDLLAKHRPHEIAVLFRSGFHSYHLETALRKSGIAFRKYGGLRFVEAAHVKDIMSFARLAINPLDMPSFSRLAGMCKGIGPKTALKLHNVIMKEGDKFTKAFQRYPQLMEDMELINSMRCSNLAPVDFFEKVIAHYRPRLESLYPDDWPSRIQGLEEIPQIAQGYDELDLFVADMALENPDEKETDSENYITLSTVHSAKGLEWNAVLLLDLVEDRFPTRHAQARPEDYEEERRLFYVACTRARQTLEIYAPATVYNRAEGCSALVSQSPFLRELSAGAVQTWKEIPGGLLKQKQLASRATRESNALSHPAEGLANNFSVLKAGQKDTSYAKNGGKIEQGSLGYCRHRIFGRGKIVRIIDEEKVQVNFPGFGLKVILGAYLIMEGQDG